MQNVQYNQNYNYSGNNGGRGQIPQSNNGNSGSRVYGNVQLTWRGGPSNNDSGYTEPNWQERRYDENGEQQGNTRQRTPDRLNTIAADPLGTNEGMRPRLNSKRARDGPDQPADDGPPQARTRQ
jgi:hypothetical protein